VRVSVVIPTLNGGPKLAALLECLRAQQPGPPDELVVVDSGSSDDTCELAAAAGARIVKWDEPYDHGLARDAGISAATGELVFLTVQDALPASRDWLAHMAAHFQDTSVAGASSPQIPPPDGPLELRIKAGLESGDMTRFPALWKSGSCPRIPPRIPLRISLAEHPGYASYPPARRLELYRFDNVCSALRRAVWERIPFGACRYAEDLQWARRVLEAGHALVWDPAAQVIHAHRRAFVYEFRRALLDAWVMDEVFDYRYRWLDKLDRARMLATSQPGGPPHPTLTPLGRGQREGPGLAARLAAARTYAAHALARTLYNCHRAVLKPLGWGEQALPRLTRGI